MANPGVRNEKLLNRAGRCLRGRAGANWQSLIDEIVVHTDWDVEHDCERTRSLHGRTPLLIANQFQNGIALWLVERNSMLDNLNLPFQSEICV